MKRVVPGRNGFAKRSELNASNRLEAIDILHVSVVAYSFNIINWKMSDINGLDTKTRKLLTVHRIHNRG